MQRRDKSICIRDALISLPSCEVVDDQSNCRVLTIGSAQGRHINIPTRCDFSIRGGGVVQCNARVIRNRILRLTRCVRLNRLVDFWCFNIHANC